MMLQNKMKEKKVDKFFLIILILLITIGVAMFISASLGILGKDATVEILARKEKIFYSILFNQIVLGLGMGLIGMYASYKINYKFWRQYSFYIFLASILLTASVFIPHVGSSHGGATRWINIGPISLQPVEFLKFGFIIYFAAWMSWAKNKITDLRYGILPLCVMLSVIALILFKQPDTKSFILIALTGFSMLFISGVPLRYLAGLAVSAVCVLSLLVFTTPYLQKRVQTFINPASDPNGSSYQIRQSLIAFGSGGLFGRGFGQSIQKFSYLPEPQGDSIFAVIGEEFGFVGAFGVVFLYVLFLLRGIRIAKNSPDTFSGLLVAGIVILITLQSFMHIASNTGVGPLTGVPLVFMSHGGTSLMIYLVAMGVVLQISKFKHHYVQ